MTEAKLNKFEFSDDIVVTLNNALAVFKENTPPTHFKNAEDIMKVHAIISAFGDNISCDAAGGTIHIFGGTSWRCNFKRNELLFIIRSFFEYIGLICGVKKAERILPIFRQALLSSATSKMTLMSDILSASEKQDEETTTIRIPVNKNEAVKKFIESGCKAEQVSSDTDLNTGYNKGYEAGKKDGENQGKDNYKHWLSYNVLPLIDLLVDPIDVDETDSDTKKRWALIGAIKALLNT